MAINDINSTGMAKFGGKVAYAYRLRYLSGVDGAETFSISPHFQFPSQYVRSRAALKPMTPKKGPKIDVSTKLAEEVYGAGAISGEVDKFSSWGLRMRSWKDWRRGGWD
jgi:hypothetical protein